jgi:D-alanine transaminase
MTVYLNGTYLPKSEAKVSVEDRGFIFGDGVYEVWRVINGRLFEMNRHHARLTRGLGEVRITPPAESHIDTLQEIAERLLAENDLTEGEGTLYLEITRGAAPRVHHFPPPDTRPTVYAMVNRFVPPEDTRAKGVTTVTVPDVRWMRCDIKTIQLLPNVMAKQAASERGATEAILVRDGVVTEGSHTNVMGVLGGEIRTHPANHLILPGITRAVVLELARELGIPVREQPIAASDVPKAEELFLVGTTMDVMPVVRVDEVTIGAGKPGPIAQRLYAALRAHLDATAAAAIA